MGSWLRLFWTWGTLFLKKSSKNVLFNFQRLVIYSFGCFSPSFINVSYPRSKRVYIFKLESLSFAYTLMSKKSRTKDLPRNHKHFSVKISPPITKFQAQISSKFFNPAAMRNMPHTELCLDFQLLTENFLILLLSQKLTFFIHEDKCCGFLVATRIPFYTKSVKKCSCLQRIRTFFAKESTEKTLPLSKFSRGLVIAKIDNNHMLNRTYQLQKIKIWKWFFYKRNSTLIWSIYMY